MSFIEPHKKEWIIEFELLKNALLEAINIDEIDIQHVGSTAIPQLIAKPILDIDIIIHKTTPLNEIIEKLEKIGYINKGEQGIPGRFAFRQHSEWTPLNTHKKWQKHHLYVCFSDSLAVKNHLLFRDALLNDENLVKQYATLKTNLLQEKGMTKELYSIRKTDFIVSVLSSLGFDNHELDEIIKSNS